MFLHLAFEACARHTGIAQDEAVDLLKASEFAFAPGYLHAHSDLAPGYVNTHSDFGACIDCAAKLSENGSSTGECLPDTMERCRSSICHDVPEQVAKTCGDWPMRASRIPHREPSAWASDGGRKRVVFQNDFEELVQAQKDLPQLYPTGMSVFKLSESLLLEEQVTRATQAARSKARAAERHVQIQRVLASKAAEAMMMSRRESLVGAASALSIATITNAMSEDKEGR